MILIRLIMFNKLNKIKLAIIKILNSAHVNEKKYEYKDRFRNIILSQNLRIKFILILFEDLNLLITFIE